MPEADAPDVTVLQADLSAGLPGAADRPAVVVMAELRRILVDDARRRHRLKRDHGVRVTREEGLAESPERSIDLLVLDDAVQQLDSLAPRQARVVELRFFGGLDIDETATALVISPATVKRDWTFARAFLLTQLEAA